MNRRMMVAGAVIAGALILIGMWWSSRARADARVIPTGAGGGRPTGGTGGRPTGGGGIDMDISVAEADLAASHGLSVGSRATLGMGAIGAGIGA